jgi:hypothetical protein
VPFRRGDDVSRPGVPSLIDDFCSIDGALETESSGSPLPEALALPRDVPPGDPRVDADDLCRPTEELCPDHEACLGFTGDGVRRTSGVIPSASKWVQLSGPGDIDERSRILLPPGEVRASAGMAKRRDVRFKSSPLLSRRDLEDLHLGTEEKIQERVTPDLPVLLAADLLATPDHSAAALCSRRLRGGLAR